MALRRVCLQSIICTQNHYFPDYLEGLKRYMHFVLLNVEKMKIRYRLPSQTHLLLSFLVTKRFIQCSVNISSDLVFLRLFNIFLKIGKVDVL